MGHLKLVNKSEPAKQQADMEKAIKILDEEAREMSESERDFIDEELEKEQTYNVGQYVEDYSWTDDSATFYESIENDIGCYDDDY